MHHLLMRALHGPAADPIAQSQVLIIVHAGGIVTVVANQALQLFAQLRCLRPHALQSCDDILDLAGAQVFRHLMDPAVGLLRSFPVSHPGEVPGILQGVPEIQDFAAAYKHLGPVPNPLGAVTHDHHHGIGRVQPAQFAELGIQMAEDAVGIPQATHQKPANQAAASRRGFHPFAGQQ